MQAKKKKVMLGLAGALLLGSSLLAGCGSSTNSSGSTGNGDQSASSKSAANKTVTIGYVNWAEDVAVTNLWKTLLEQKGYTVNTKTLDAGPLFVGLSEGGVDLFLDTWLPYTHKQYIDKYGSKLSDLGVWYQGDAKEGIVVPDYVTINSVADLNSQASKFQNQIIGIDPGAGLMKLTKKAISDYNLKLNLVSGSETAMLTALKRGITNHQWVAVTGWSPHWMFAKYQLKYLADPKGDFGKAEKIHVEANKNWASSNTKVAGWMKNFKLTPKQLGNLEEDVNSTSNKSDGVKKWIKDNQSTVDSWFK